MMSVTPGRNGELFGTEGVSSRTSLPSPSLSVYSNSTRDTSPSPFGGAAEALENDCLELEHVIGFTGRYPDTVHFHPSDPDTFIKSMGSVIAICNLQDPHKQEFLRGHDAPVSVVTISRTGSMVVSGQVGSARHKARAAPVIIWDYRSRAPMHRLDGHFESVCAAKFSPDERYLITTGLEGGLSVWDVGTGELMSANRRAASPVLIMEWGSVSGPSRRPVYSFCSAMNSQVLLSRLEFDVRSMRYVASAQPVLMPTVGLVRTYTVAQFVTTAGPDGGPGDEFILVGSSAGDVLLFSATHRVYRASVPVASNGVLSLIALSADAPIAAVAASSFDRFAGAGASVGAVPPPTAASSRAGSGHAGVRGRATVVPGPIIIFAGGGDGVLRKLRGGEAGWVLEAELVLSGGVTSLSLSPDGAELLAGTSAGRLYRVLAADLASAEVGAAHVAPVTLVAFGRSRSDLFATGGRDGSLRVWDLSDYRLLALVPRDGSGPHAATGSGNGGSSGGGLEPLCLGFHAAPDDRMRAGGDPSGGGEGVLLSGWSDHSLRAHDVRSGAKLWTVADAHRAPVTALISAPAAGSGGGGGGGAIITGASDGNVRVWAASSRLLLMQFNEHRGPVTQLAMDCTSARACWLVHSCGADKQLFSYDLRSQRRVNARQVREGALQCLSQRIDSEQELITGGADGRILFWDCDVVDPVQGFMDPLRCSVTALAVSPSGRYLAYCGNDQQVKIVALDNGGGAPAPALPAQSASRAGYAPPPAARPPAPLALLAVGHGHSAGVRSLRWSPDEKQIISVADDCCICVWNFFGM